METTEKQVVVVAGPGSGKSRVLTERVKWLLDNGEKPSEIFAITFTNMASDEMKQRLGLRAEGCYIGTIHGLANYILLRNGIDTFNFIKDENFDAMFDAIIRNHCKIPTVKHLLVDEFQDTGEKEYDFLMYTLRPQCYFLIGDTRQKIYEFKTGKRDFFQEQLDNPFTQVYELKDNYRSYREITDFGKKKLTGVPNIYFTPTHSIRGCGGKIIQEDFTWSAMVKYLTEYPTYRDWFILCRTNDEVDKVMNFLKWAGVPAITFKKSETTLAEIKAKMEQEAVKVLTIHQSKGLESKYVMTLGMRFYNAEEKRINYVAITRAEDMVIWFEKFDEFNKKSQKKNTQKKKEQKVAEMAMEDWG